MIVDVDIYTIEFEFEKKGRANINPFYDSYEELVSITKVTLNDEENGDEDLEFESLSEALKNEILDRCHEIGRSND